MEKIRILCYGDSNTWGYISGSDHKRYGIGERWTSILEELLGNDFKIIEEGAGEDFDPKLVEIFMQARNKILDYYETEK